MLLEGWKKFEEEHGTAEDVERVEGRMPQVTKRWRKLDSGDMEECTSRPYDLEEMLMMVRLGYPVRRRRARGEPCDVQVFAKCTRVEDEAGWWGYQDEFTGRVACRGEQRRRRRG